MEASSPLKGQNGQVEAKQQAGTPHKIGVQDFEVLGQLGKGAYGEVSLVRKKENSKLFAMKVIDKAFLAKERKQHQVFCEKEVLNYLNHPNIIKLQYSFQDKEKLYFVLELVEGGSFAEFLNVYKKLPMDVIKFYAAEIVNILEYLHSNGIAHRDMKPHNLMIGNDLHLRAIDFGTAKAFEIEGHSNDLFKRLVAIRLSVDPSIDPTKHRSSFVGTPEFVSPELLEDAKAGPAVDLWALGCIIYQMYTSHLPFTAPNEYFIFEKIKSGTFDLPEDTPADMKDIVQKLLEKDPEKRLGAGPKGSDHDYTALKSHPFFAGINFETLPTMTPPKMPGPPVGSIVETDSPSHLIDPRASEILKEIEDKHYHHDQDDRLLATHLKNEKEKASHLVISGILLKKCGWIFYKPRRVFVYKDPPRLIYFGVEDNEFRSSVPLKKDTTVEYDGANRFILDVNTRTYIFKENDIAINNWVDLLRQTINKFWWQ